MGDVKRPKNWLLIKVREWHSWLGVGVAAFVMVVCASGIYLNHKDFFEFGKREEAERKAVSAKGKGEGPSGALTTATDVGALAVTPRRALEVSRAHLGEGAAIEKIELKDEKGSLVYKIKGAGEREVVVSAATGAVTVKGGYGKKEFAAAAKGGGEPVARAGYDWGKVIKDLHTGKLGGLAGKLLVDATGVVLMGLTLSGLYLWGVPKWRKRRAARVAREEGAKTAAAAAAGRRGGELVNA